MHPQLVAGAWVGFNDSRVTLRSDYWGQGAHSALPIVGDFYQRALRTRVIDGRARFAEADEKTWYTSITGQVRGWFQRLFASNKSDQAPATPRPAPRRPVLPATEAEAMPSVGSGGSGGSGASAAMAGNGQGGGANTEHAESAEPGMALDPNEVVEVLPASEPEPAMASAPGVPSPFPVAPAMAPAPVR
ncbi:hypothetical protein D3C72_1368570 [compost metagenome]